MSDFALYRNLFINSKDKALSMIQKKKLAKQISLLDQEGNDLVYCLIRFHHISEADQSKTKPINLYGLIIDNEYSTSNLTFDLSQLPSKLQQILLKFVSMNETHKQELKIKENGG